MSIIVPGQLQRNPLTGKLQRNSATGKIRRAKNSSQLICCCNTGCPCGPDPVSRSGLPDVIPVTISGVTIPSGCLVAAEFFSYVDEAAFEVHHSGLIARQSLSWTYTSVPINQKFCLTRVAGSCYWFVDVPCDVTYWFGLPTAPVGGAIEAEGTAPVCDCGSPDYGTCNSFHVDTMRAILSVNEYPGIGAIPILAVELLIPVAYIPLLSFFYSGTDLFVANGLLSGQTIPCSSTLSMNNTTTWYRTQYGVDLGPFNIADPFGLHFEWITDPGGACSVGIDPVCPASPGNSFGGSALIDMTGAACP